MAALNGKYNCTLQLSEAYTGVITVHKIDCLTGAESIEKGGSFTLVKLKLFQPM